MVIYELILFFLISYMPLHQKAFWAMSFFLVGVLGASIFISWPRGFFICLGLWLLTVCSLLMFRKYGLAVLSIAVLIGITYYGWQHAQFVSERPQLSQTGNFNALILTSRTEGETQALMARLDTGMRIQFTTKRYPEYSYGDRVTLSGVLQPVAAENGYYAKERISGTMRFPVILLVAHDQGIPIFRALFAIRKSVITSFQKALPPEQATFLSGLTLGRSVGFSKEFSQKLKDTGTTHLVALSGYNVSIIAIGITALFSFWFSRRRAFIISVLAIIGFVLMTGAESSVVRAAIMAIIVLIAERAGRLYLMRNAIVAAAFVMTLLNPEVLTFDIGFQLSFLALLGIVYLKPALAFWLNIPNAPGFLQWRKNLWTTIAAQLAVLPVLLLHFGFFAPIALVTNILILVFIPATMMLGFCVFLASLFSSVLALIVALPARLLLAYELGVINFFSNFPMRFSVATFSLAIVLIYYGILILFIAWMQYRKQRIV